MGALSTFEEVRRFLDTLAWPGVTVTGMLVFRGPVAGLIGRVRKASWGDRTVELAEEIRELAEAVAKPDLDDTMKQEVVRRLERAAETTDSVALLDPDAMAVASRSRARRRLQPRPSFYEDQGQGRLLLSLTSAPGGPIACVVLSPVGKHFTTNLNRAGASAGDTVTVQWPTSFTGALPAKIPGLWQWTWVSAGANLTTDARQISTGGWFVAGPPPPSAPL